MSPAYGPNVVSSRQPLHIVHVISNLGYGGAETALARLIRYSSPLGFRHTVISLSRRGDLADMIEDAGGKVVALSPALGMALKAVLRGHPPRRGGLGPDVIQGWMMHGNLVAWALRTFRYRRAGLAWNLRMTLVGIAHERSRTLWMTRMLSHLSRRVDLLIANSETSLRDHLRVGYRPRATVVVPNGFDPSVFRDDAEDRHQTRAAWGLPDGIVAFGLVGRYHRTKGHEVFIRAAAQVLRRQADARFVLAGTGTDTDEELKALLAGHGVASAFILLGVRRDIPSVMRALDVVCVPSEYESFPNVLGEAMASARPCIATNVSDVATIMGDAGMLIEVGDAVGLADAMLAMLDMGGKGREALGNAAREHIIDKYSLESVVTRYEAHYAALAGPA
jgi:glycosyltransferase involved in cell wall biosynthesis